MIVLTLILVGGEGSRLSILGEKRAKPAVPVGSEYRIIGWRQREPVSGKGGSDGNP